jgi:hypothetical protein
MTDGLAVYPDRPTPSRAKINYTPRRKQSFDFPSAAQGLVSLQGDVSSVVCSDTSHVSERTTVDV